MNHTKVQNEKVEKISKKKISEIAISSNQMYEIENIGHSKFGMKKVLMMENAGFGVADFIIKKFKNKPISKLKILAICGSGNNGGDAMVTARHLTCLGINLKVDTKIKKQILKADIIIDGIFGTGIKGEIQDPHLSVIKLINKSKSYIIAVDIPSGLNPNTGETTSNVIRANTTITFHRIKVGLLNNKKYTGNLILKKIGIPIEAEDGIV